MANHKSSEKRARQDIKKTAQNKANESKVKTAVKSLRKSIADKNKTEAKTKLVKVQSMLFKLAKTKVITKGTAARKTSRLATQVNSLA